MSSLRLEIDYWISVSQPALPLPPTRRSLLRYAHLHNRQRLLLPGQQYDIGIIRYGTGIQYSFSNLQPPLAQLLKT